MFSDGPEVARLIPQEISHYRIIERLGAGGMGEVFLAQDVRLDRKVAIKMLPAKSIGDEQAKKRLFREAKAAATLDHPNICAIYEVGEEGDCAFIAMQYIEGRTLSRIIKNNALSPLEVVDIGIQAAEALAEAHSRGVIHRDIKPQNVIITPRGRVKILDFGLAKIVRDEGAIHTAEADSRLTDTGEVVGTVGYMSPEQLRDLPVDARSDLFSLGVLLYECATGRSAFVGSTKIQISLQVIEVDPQKPSELCTGVPSELDDIILKAIAKDVDARYQSAGAMLADLRRMEDALQGSILNTRPLTPGPRSSRRRASGGLSSKIRTAPVTLKLGLILVPLVILGSLWAIRIARPSMHQPSPEARKWYEDGTRAMRVGAFYEASKQLEQSLFYDDGFLLAHARLAQTYLELDNTDKAREEMLRALSLRDQSSLGSEDSAYVDAVAATVVQQFPKALDHYRKLADQAPESEKSSAYLDLGRAYERTENIDKAQEYYQKAIDKESQSAAGYLRLAVLRGRRQDLKGANDALNKAGDFYDKMSNQEGRAEVFYQRGTLLAKTTQLTDARKNLEEALEISLNGKNEYQIVKTKLQLSALCYAQGDTQRATDLATEAIDRARNSRIQNLATGGLINLGYALLYRGKQDEAGQRFKQALEFAQQDKSRSSEARATLALGALSRQKGNPDEAIPLIEKALTFYKEADYPKETSTALIALASAHSDKGEYEVAMQTFEQQRQLASDLGDQAQLARVHSSIGALLGVEQEKYPLALVNVDESYRINTLRGSKSDAAYDQMNRANLLWQLGRYKEANDALNDASALADLPDQPEANLKTLLAWVHLVHSQMALSEGRFSYATTEGQKALQLGAKQYIDIDVNGKFSIALAQALSGASQPAKLLCQEAAATARESRIPRLISSAQLALAEVLLLARDAEGALRAAQEAQPLCARSGQQDSEWRAWLMAARASQLAGDQPVAQQYAAKAKSLCEGLREKWGADAYEGYLRRPDVQKYLSQIDKIISRSK
jgi:serine/threonine protein kinase/Tfp pilus assembly protein PilF